MLSIWIATASAGPAHAALKTDAVLPVSVVAPGESVFIELDLTNRTQKSLYFPDFTSDACWVDKYAAIELDPPRAVVVPPTECKSSGSTRVAPDDTFSRKVNLTSLYGLPPETIHAIKIQWKEGGADVYSPTDLRVGPVDFKTPFFNERVLPGDPIFLPDKSQLLFVKFVAQPPLKPGQQEMLELEMVHKVPGKGETPKTFKIPFRVTQQFRYGGYTFQVPQHQYGQWMQLRVFE